MRCEAGRRAGDDREHQLEATVGGTHHGLGAGADADQARERRLEMRHHALVVQRRACSSLPPRPPFISSEKRLVFSRR